ncbi:MAG: hypothetical protein JNJ59_17860 [Deltaproteobacteria bacterium]|nr:hypothetical protein [Deltaproteobacteria bacterium]
MRAISEYTPGRFVLAALGVLALGIGACGDDPVAYSETVSLKLSGIKNGDIKNGQAEEEKEISTESGNPYGEFLKNAKAALGGKDPGAIELVSAFVRVHSDSKNVSALEAVFTSLELFLTTSNTTLPVGTVANPSGTSIAVSLDENIDYEPIFANLLAGSFKGGVRGPTVATPPADFDLRLTLDLKFTAYE